MACNGNDMFLNYDINNTMYTRTQYRKLFNKEAHFVNVVSFNDSVEARVQFVEQFDYIHRTELSREPSEADDVAEVDSDAFITLGCNRLPVLQLFNDRPET